MLSLPDITIPAGEEQNTGTLILSAVDDSFFEGTEEITVTGSAGALPVTGTSFDLSDNDAQPTLQLALSENTILEGGSKTIIATSLLVGGSTFEDDLELQLSSTVNLDDVYTSTPALPHTFSLTAGMLSTTVDLNVEALQKPSAVIRWRVRGRALGVTFESSWIGLSIVDADPTPVAVGVVVDPVSPAFLYVDDPETTVRVKVSLIANDQEVTLENDVTVRVETGSDGASFSVHSPTYHEITIPAGSSSRIVEFSVTPYIIKDDVTYLSYFASSYSGAGVSHRSSRRRVQVRRRGTPSLSSIEHRIRASSSVSGRVALAGDRIGFTVSFDRRFTVDSATLRFSFDSGDRTATCRSLDAVRFSRTCGYTIVAGDSDRDGVIVIPAGGFAVTGMRDSADAPVTPTTTPATTMRLEYTPASVNAISGGGRAIQFYVDPQSVQEGEGGRVVTVSAQDVNGHRAETETIAFEFADGTATGPDYTVSGDRSITIPGGLTDGSATLTLTALEDGIRENRTETLQVGSRAFPGSWATLTVIDSPSIRLTLSEAQVTEDGGPQAVTVTAALSDPQDAVRPRSIQVALTWGGTATGEDYAVVGETVTIPANAREGTTVVTITPTDDRLLEGDETIELRGTTPALAVVGTELTLADDEVQPQVVLEVDDDTLLESETWATEVAVTATLDPSVMVSADTVVTLELGGNAMAGASDDYTASWSPAARQITIPAGSYSGSAAVMLTLTPLQDSVVEGDETIVVEGAARVQNVDMDEMVVQVATITLADDDVRGVILEPPRLDVDEGGSGEYQVSLSSQPTATVTVSIAGDSETDLSLDTASLTFTTSDWSTAQTVTVNAGQDEDAVDDTETLTHRASGGDYASVAVELPVTVDDDEGAGIELSPTSLNPAEGGDASYTVSLSSAPTAAVTVAIGGTTDTDLTLDPASLAFTTSDWSTAQTVTVSAGQDDDAVDDEATLTHTASGGDYAGKTADLSVTVDDDETVGIELNPTSLTPSEGGSESYTVALSSEPTASVTVAIGGTTDTDLSLDTASLTFTTSDWSTAQTVTVSAGQDDDAVDDTATLTHTASGGDYAGRRRLGRAL